MKKEEFEKKKSLLVKNGLNTIKGLEDTFKAILKHDWYGEWEYPDEIRAKFNYQIDPVEFKFLFKKLRTLISELAKFPDKFEVLWEKGLK